MLLDWAYKQATSTLPGLGSIEDLAAEHLRAASGDAERAIDRLVSWQMGKAGAAGLLGNLGGVLTLPVTLPANVASVLVIQLRMIAAIAHLRGHDIRDDGVRSFALLCLAGSGLLDVARTSGKAVGARLAGRATQRLAARGLAGAGRLVPILGGLVGAAVDAASTRAVAAMARRSFPPVRQPS